MFKHQVGRKTLAAYVPPQPIVAKRESGLDVSFSSEILTYICTGSPDKSYVPKAYAGLGELPEWST